MPLELILIGSSDLLSIDPYDTLIQIHACSNLRTWRNLFRKQNHGNSHAQTPPMPHTYMRKCFIIPHSHLVHFELIQTCCLSSYAMHIRYLDHSRTRPQTLSAVTTIIQKLVVALKEKEKQEVSHHVHDSSFKKREKKKKNEEKMTKAKI